MARLARIGWLIGLFLWLPVTGWAVLAVGTASAQEAPAAMLGDSFFMHKVPASRAASAAQLAEAMDIAPHDLITAEVLSGHLDRAFAIYGRIPGTWFPTRAESFLFMSTGDAYSTVRRDYILDDTIEQAQLRLTLRVPSWATCANFDFAFYTREPGPVVPAWRNDFFVAQLDTGLIQRYEAPGVEEIIAPGNFALGRHGEVISVRNTYSSPAVSELRTQDGAVSPLLRASVGVSPNTTIDIFLTVRDAGPPTGDSAVALDHFFWNADAPCVTGRLGDADEDGLPDGWEVHGVTMTYIRNQTETKFVDLPSMGADPRHRDVFVEVDSMALNLTGELLLDYTPTDSVIGPVVEAFAKAPIPNPDGTLGIRLHVDYANTAPLTWTSPSTLTWGRYFETPTGPATLGNAQTLPFLEFILHCDDDGTMEWANVDRLKRSYLEQARALVFHYAIWAHNLCAPLASGDAKGPPSGQSRNWPGRYFGLGASDFVVTLGPKSTLSEQTGTFMHELGHNLGLMHGGIDDIPYKPNHLSVMNWGFQMRGLTKDGKEGHFDYAHFDVPPLYTNRLWETQGVYTHGVHSDDRYGTWIYCDGHSARHYPVLEAWKPIDWNCDNSFAKDGPISAQVLPCAKTDCTVTELRSVNEWEILAYTGGLLRRDVNILTKADSIPPYSYLYSWSSILPYTWISTELTLPGPVPPLDLAPATTNYPELDIHAADSP